MEVEEINFDCLRPADRISIHTANHVYEFSVTDPASHAGILKGGVLGKKAMQASLLCDARETGRESPALKLVVGAKALFLCASQRGLRRLITSQVRKLSYNREGRPEDAPAA